MRNIIPVLAACVMLVACDEDPGPTVMVIASETGEIAIAANQLSRVSATHDNGEHFLAFSMNATITKAFADMTTENLGKKVSLSVCGRVVTEPIIMSPITNGTGQISGLFADEVDDVLAILKGKAPCP